MKNRPILGIESSCDDTAAAIVADGRTIVSSVVSNQEKIHCKYGGVVPELASRKHMESITLVVEAALEEAGITLAELGGVAATMGPGLVGSLLVGFSFAKAFAYARNLPFAGVDHLEGHISSLFLMDNPPEFPFVALLASGGHTIIFYVKSILEMEVMGQTRDDAAGEAFDKVAKLLGLEYPGGRRIDEFAEKGDPKKIKFPRTFLDKTGFEFSFSGVKTAVARFVEQQEKEQLNSMIPDIAAGFREAVVDVLCSKLLLAAKTKNCKQIAIAGGVAANKRLRERIEQDAAKNNLTAYIPPISLCGDNAAMIAALGFHHINASQLTSLDGDAYSRASFRNAAQLK